MRRPKPRRVARLRIEPLEDRSLPAAAWQVEAFDRPTAGGFVAGWAQWSALGPGAFTVSTAHASSGSYSLAAVGGSGVTARAWRTEPVPADFGARARVWLGGLEPVQLFARGRDLGGAAPTYMAVSVARGLQVQLVRV